MSISASKFFSLVVPVAALVVTVSVFATNTNIISKAKKGPGYNTELKYDFAAGWNSFSLPINSSFTADDVCNMVESSTTVARMESNTWDYYSCVDAEAGTNFSIVPHHGYMVKLSDSSSWKLNGNRAKPSYEIQSGLNFAGVPQAANTRYYAHTLCDLKTDTNSEVASVSDWTGTSWNTHNCATEANNNYQIEAGKGYIVNVKLNNSAAPVVPSLR